ESALHQGIESGQVGVGQRNMSPATACVARDRANARERFVVRDECPARAHVAGADAVIDEGAAVALGVPRRDRVGANLQLERRRHAVVRIVAVALGILSVGVEIDEPGRDDETRDREGLARRERLDGHRRDPAVLSYYLMGWRLVTMFFSSDRDYGISASHVAGTGFHEVE